MSVRIVSACDPQIRDLLIHDPLNTVTYELLIVYGYNRIVRITLLSYCLHNQGGNLL